MTNTLKPGAVRPLLNNLLQSLLVLPLLIPILLCGCGALDFDVQQGVPEQRVTGSLAGALFGTLIPSPFPLTIDLAQETKACNTGPVKAVGLKSLTFAITNIVFFGSVYDFSFV